MVSVLIQTTYFLLKLIFLFFGKVILYVSKGSCFPESVWKYKHINHTLD